MMKMECIFSVITSILVTNAVKLKICKIIVHEVFGVKTVESISQFVCMGKRKPLNRYISLDIVVVPGV